MAESCRCLTASCPAVLKSSSRCSGSNPTPTPSPPHPTPSIPYLTHGPILTRPTLTRHTPQELIELLESKSDAHAAVEGGGLGQARLTHTADGGEGEESEEDGDAAVSEVDEDEGRD